MINDFKEYEIIMNEYEKEEDINNASTKSSTSNKAIDIIDQLTNTIGSEFMLIF